MKYRVRLYEARLKEVVTTKQIADIVLQKIDFYLENPYYILTAEIKDEKGNEKTFDEPEDILFYLDQRRMLPDNIRQLIANFVSGKYEASREEAIQLVVEKQPKIKAVLTLLTHDLPTRTQVANMAKKSKKIGIKDILHALSNL